MEQNRRQRRDARRRRNQKRVTGCFNLLATLIILIAAFAIIRILDGAGIIRWTDTLAENPLSPSDFRTVGSYVTCTSVPTRRGVDVSEYQEDVDWSQVRDAGFDFAFIRIGYRGNTTGEIYADDLARENLAGARAADMDVGVYFYSQAISPAEAVEEAHWCLEYLDGEELDLPVVFDWEYVGGSARTMGMDKSTLTQCAIAFCDTLEEAGYGSMIYFNPHVSRDLLDLKQLQGYPWWLAQYKDQMDYPYQVDIWQYTEEGTVPGIIGNVDIDLMFLYE